MARTKKIPLDLDRFQANLDRVREEAALAATRSENSTAPRIVIVTKYLEPADTARLRDEGVGPLGENRAQELEDKVNVAEDRDGWHFIGHLQRNKIARVVPRVSMIHSIDSVRLARAVDHWIEDHGSGPISCLVEVNISGEGTKGGMSPGQAETEIPAWTEAFDNLHVEGLMTMAPFVDAESCRAVFRSLRGLRDTIRAQLHGEAEDRFSELSMGMSNDYWVAAEEGATILRIGRVLYE